MERGERVSNFWFGFGLGIFFTAFFAFLFGTRKGRKNLKKFLDYLEKNEENWDLIFEEIKLFFQKIKESKKEISQKEKKINLNFYGIIDRINYLANPIKKQTKKFFFREGRIIEKNA